MDGIGCHRWVIPEGWIPGWSHGPAPLLTSHEAACILNANDADAHVSITIYFEDREPAGPFAVVVPARRTRHVRFNDLGGEEPIPASTAYSSIIESDQPVVVQHTRLDSRSRRVGLLSTVAYPA
jgi:hypothetical protein